MAGGATPELVDQQSGVLTPSVEEHALDQAFQEFIQKEFDRQAIQDRARAHILPHQQFWKE